MANYKLQTQEKDRQILTMKKCDYCGRENEQLPAVLPHCGQCNQAFKEVLKVKEAPLPERSSGVSEAHVSNMLSAGYFKGWEPLDLAGFDMGFSFEEGFSRPDWKLISQQDRDRIRQRTVADRRGGRSG